MGGIQTANLPGVGRKYWLEADDGGRISLIAYHDGTWELYLTPAGEEFPTSAVRLSREEAKGLAGVLPADDDAATKSELPAASCVIVHADSPAIGREAADLRHGAAFVAAVAAMNREDVEAPSEHMVRATDVLWLMGPEEDREALARSIRGA